MAYTIDLAGICSERNCPKPSVVMVRDNRNSDIRACCREHGEALAKTLTEEGR